MAAMVVLLTLVSAGGYIVGRRSGEDLEAARAAGTRQGTALGTKRDYQAGYRRGRAAGYQAAYRRSYRAFYATSFERAGIAAPREIAVPELTVPEEP